MLCACVLEDEKSKHCADSVMATARKGAKTLLWCVFEYAHFPTTTRTGANFVSCTSLSSNEDINENTVIHGVSKRTQPNDRVCCAYTLDKKNLSTVSTLPL